jgi:hypothetical protein
MLLAFADQERILAISLVSFGRFIEALRLAPAPHARHLHRSCTGNFDRFFYFIFNNFHVGGAPGEIRTPDLLVRSQALYPTELRAQGARILPHRLLTAIASKSGELPLRDLANDDAESIRWVDFGRLRLTHPFAGERD